MTKLLDSARSVASVGLTGVAKVLRTAAGVAGGFASLLKPPAESDPATQRRSSFEDDPASGSMDVYGEVADDLLHEAEDAEDGYGLETDEEPAEEELDYEVEDEVEPADVFDEGGDDADVPAPEVPEPDTGRASAPPTHLAALARGTVDEITRSIDGMSTDELRQLHEYESTHRRRKRVLNAVERALTP